MDLHTTDLTFLSACGSQTVKPSWIDNPGNGTSASAVNQIMGKDQQEELAITRASERMSRVMC